jgi:hypothetical protein
MSSAKASDSPALQRSRSWVTSLLEETIAAYCNRLAAAAGSRRNLAETWPVSRPVLAF